LELNNRGPTKKIVCLIVLLEAMCLLQLPKRVFQLRNNKTIWFFSGYEYARININPDQVQHGPRALPGDLDTFKKVGWIQADAFLSERTLTGSYEEAFVLTVTNL
jgi:hypothetical protein